MERNPIKNSQPFPSTLPPRTHLEDNGLFYLLTHCVCCKLDFSFSSWAGFKICFIQQVRTKSSNDSSLGFKNFDVGCTSEHTDTEDFLGMESFLRVWMNNDE